MKKYPGHTADEIKFYSTRPLRDIRPKRVIIVAGANDISSGFRDKNLDEARIVQNILGIAEKTRYYGADKIFIASLLERRGYKYQNVISRINDELYIACIIKGYIYMDNCEIELERHIGRDGLHPNVY